MLSKIHSGSQSNPVVVYGIRGLAFGLLLLLSFAAKAQTGISVGYTGMHDGQRGQVYMLDYVPQGSPWDFTAGAIRGTLDRDTSFVALSYEIVDQHLYASFGPALIRHQTGTLTSQYQFMTTFGFHRDDWSLGVRHMSNGGLRGDNVGENFVFVSWNF
jgi:hypothetical protein